MVGLPKGAVINTGYVKVPVHVGPIVSGATGGYPFGSFQI
jgi:hypothetical protein